MRGPFPDGALFGFVQIFFTVVDVSLVCVDLRASQDGAAARGDIA